MFAMTHAAMFHVAVAEHFVDRADLEDDLGPPDFPGFASVVRGPGTLTRRLPFGMRFPLIKPRRRPS